jgi:hypothetical protein
VDGIRTGRFLDTPEFTAFHDKGNNETIFDRFDYHPTGKDAIHLNLFTARSWFQIPNDYDQLGQDQHERVLTWNIVPGYQHTFSSHTLLTINPYIRKDQVNYYASRAFRRYASDAKPEPSAPQLGRQGRHCHDERPQHDQVRCRFEANTITGEFRLWYHRSGL